MQALCGLSSSPALLLSPHRQRPLLTTLLSSAAAVRHPRAFPCLQLAAAPVRLHRRDVLLGVVAMAAADAVAAPAAVVAPPIEVFVKAAAGHPDKLGDCKLNFLPNLGFRAHFHFENLPLGICRS